MSLIGRVRTKAIIDTGAPDSLGNLALLEALKKQARTIRARTSWA